MARRQFNRNRQSSRRPNRAWTGTFSVAPVVIPANSAVLLSTFALSNQGIDETVLRTVGVIYMTSDTVGVGEDQTGAFGLTVVNDVALALGITGIPDPITNVQDDVWFVYQPLLGDTEYATAVGQQMGQRYDFDSKAKRVVSTGQGIAVVVANAHATHGLQLMAGFRMLTQVRGT